MSDYTFEGVDQRVDEDVAELFAGPHGPVKHIVCTECDGEGSVGPGWVWTQDDLAEEDPEEFAELQQRLRRGDYDKPCEMCGGRRVITAEELQAAKDRYEDELTMRGEQGYYPY